MINEITAGPAVSLEQSELREGAQKEREKSAQRDRDARGTKEGSVWE